jgi:hypothetical protein
LADCSQHQHVHYALKGEARQKDLSLSGCDGEFVKDALHGVSQVMVGG